MLNPSTFTHFSIRRPFCTKRLVESTSLRILRSSTNFSTFRHRYEIKKFHNNWKAWKAQAVSYPTQSCFLIACLDEDPISQLFSYLGRT